jgi:hypothetical protein
MFQMSKSRRQVLKSSVALVGAASVGGLWVRHANADANYLLPTPRSREIHTGGDIDVDFVFAGLPAGALAIDCILGFMVHTKDSNNLRVEARLNGGAPFFSYGPTDTNLTRFFQEIFGGLRLSPQTNTITFKIIGGSGSFNMRDVVLWFRRA